MTLWARYVYNVGVSAAEHRRRTERKIIYLAADSFHPDHLVTYSKAQFKCEKKVYGFHARLLTMQTLKRGCYYYTADQFGMGGISDKEMKRRRRAFVKERLRLAKLV